MITTVEMFAIFSLLSPVLILAANGLEVAQCYDQVKGASLIKH